METERNWREREREREMNIRQLERKKLELKCEVKKLKAIDKLFEE